MTNVPGATAQTNVTVGLISSAQRLLKMKKIIINELATSSYYFVSL